MSGFHTFIEPAHLDSATVSDEPEVWEGSSPWLFLLGGVVFLGAAVLFVYDLLRGVDVIRSVTGNAVGAALLILWAAHDTLYDPNSDVATTSGAAGTALLLYGLYLLGAGLVLVVSSLLHGQLQVGLLFLGAGIAAVLVGFFIFPTGAVLDSDADEVVDDLTDDEPDLADGEPAEDARPSDGSQPE